MRKPWIWNLALLLAIAVAGTHFASLITRSRPPLPEPPRVRRDPVAYHLPTGPPARASYEVISDKTLFSPARGKAGTSPVEAAKAPLPKPVPPPRATLFGVVIEEGGDRYAYMSDAAQGAGEKPRKYRAGDSFSGAKVKEIRADRVILTVGAAEHTVALRSPKEGLPPPRPPPRTARRPRPTTPSMPSGGPQPQPAVPGQGPVPRQPAEGPGPGVLPAGEIGNQRSRRSPRPSFRRRGAVRPAVDPFGRPSMEGGANGGPAYEDAPGSVGGGPQDEAW